MQVAIVLFDGLTALDAVGPYEILSRLPGAETVFVAATPGQIRTDIGALALVADVALTDATHPEIIVVPGGPGARKLLGDAVLLDWLRTAHETSTWTTSVCTGALLLGAAGLLKGIEATTHWLALESLAAYGARPVQRRVVEQGRIMTCAGVSAGIDMALTLAARVAGDARAQAIQLGIEYDPQPPFQAGSPATAPADIVERMRRRAAAST